jgi:hypothetical protein
MTTGISIRPGTISAIIANPARAVAITKAVCGSVSDNRIALKKDGFRAVLFHCGRNDGLESECL